MSACASHLLPFVVEDGVRAVYTIHHRQHRIAARRQVQAARALGPDFGGDQFFY